MRRDLVVACALVLAACGTRGRDWSLPAGVKGPLVVDGRLAFLHAGASIATFLDPAGAPLHADLTTRSRAIATTASELLVVGGRGDAPVLDRIAAATGERRRLSLAGAYDRIEVSPDSRFGVLFYDPGAVPAPGGPAARNNNELSVLDLSAGTTSVVALRSESVAPRDVVFSPDGDTAAIVLDAAVAFVSLSNPRVSVNVPLKLPGGRALQPRQALFDQAGDYLFVRASGTEDVLALDVVRGGGAIDSAVNFLFYPGAKGLSDLLVPAGAGFEHAVVAAFDEGVAGGLLALLDATGDASRTRAVRLGTAVTSLVDLGGGLVLGWNDPARTTPARTVAVAGWAPLVERVDEDRLPGGIQGAARFGDGGGFFPHGTVDGKAALTGVTLEDDGARLRVRLSPLVLGGPAQATAFASGALLVGVDVTREDSGAAPLLTNDQSFYGETGALVHVRPDTLAVDGLALDEVIVQVGVVGDHAWALHPGTLGDVTFVPLSRLERASARRVAGFLTGRLLDRGEEP